MLDLLLMMAVSEEGGVPPSPGWASRLMFDFERFRFAASMGFGVTLPSSSAGVMLPLTPGSPMAMPGWPPPPSPGALSRLFEMLDLLLTMAPSDGVGTPPSSGWAARLMFDFERFRFDASTGSGVPLPSPSSPPRASAMSLLLDLPDLTVVRSLTDGADDSRPAAAAPPDANAEGD